MDRLEAIFGNERETKIAQGLLQTLREFENPANALSITAQAQERISALIASLPRGPKISYGDMFLKLIQSGYIEVRGLTTTECLTIGPQSMIVIPQNAIPFFDENYKSG